MLLTFVPLAYFGDIIISPNLAVIQKGLFMATHGTSLSTQQLNELILKTRILPRIIV